LIKSQLLCQLSYRGDQQAEKVAGMRRFVKKVAHCNC
jgi:hypothetical protein